MKKSIFVLFTFISLVLPAQTLLFDDFNYPVRDSLEGYGFWERTGVNSKYNVKVVAPGLEFYTYKGSGIGNCIQISNEGNGDLLYQNLSSVVDSGSVYLSMLVKVDSLSPQFTEGSCISFSTTTGTSLNTRLIVKKISNKTFLLGVKKYYETQFSKDTYELHKTYLAVLKYEFINGIDNDKASLFVKADGVPVSEPNTPLAQVTVDLDLVDQSTVYLINNYAENGLLGCDIKLDGIRVGTSWESSVHAISTGYQHLYSDKIELDVYPNPTIDKINLKYELKQKSFVKISLVNSSGMVCERILNAIQNSGSYFLNWNAEKYPSGIYFVQMQINNSIQLTKFELIN